MDKLTESGLLFVFSRATCEAKKLVTQLSPVTALATAGILIEFVRLNVPNTSPETSPETIDAMFDAFRQSARKAIELTEAAAHG